MSRTGMLARRAALGLAATALLAVAGPVTAAHAGFGIAPGSFKAGTEDNNGNPATQAGAHPFAGATDFALNLRPDATADGYVRDLRFKFPPGFVGDPLATARCDRATFASFGDSRHTLRCPADSQLGIATVRVNPGLYPSDYSTPVYNVEPRDGVTAQLGFVVDVTPVIIEASVDTAGDYGLDVRLTKLPEALPIAGAKLTLWGVPNDPSHDAQRYCGDPFAPDAAGSLPRIPCAVSSPRKPFLTNPATCSAAQQARLWARPWDGPQLWSTASFRAPDVTGCRRLRFGAGVAVSGVSAKPDAPSGLNVDLDLPQQDDPGTGLAPPALRDARVLLPEGMTINPASAGGLEACSDAQLGFGSNAPVRCPDAAKIGIATAISPLLEQPAAGSVYIRSQASSDPESGRMFRLALVLENRKRGLVFKLPGHVHANRATGRLRAVFADNPQLPVSKISLKLKSGPRAPLATPRRCGPQTFAVSLSSWGGQNVDRRSATAAFCTPGLGGFSPTLDAGPLAPLAGAFSPFAISISKPDGNAPLNTLRMDMPNGLLAKLKGNVGTQVGSVTAFAGPGPNPYPFPGRVFLEGRYGDAPFSLRVVVPAKAGPFDMGEVVVRQKIYVDPKTAAVSIVSDPVPAIVGGVPVRLQRLDVNVDKPGFMVNPTSCAVKQVGARLWSGAGQTVPIHVRFQVSDCARLAVKPKLALRVTGGKRYMADNRHPGFKAILTQKSGQANLKNVAVRLPLALALDVDNANGLCEFRASELVDPACPKRSIVGYAEARSPILNRPLKAPIYFAKYETYDKRRKRMRKRLPRLIIPLRGENGVKLNVIGASTSTQDKLITTFKQIPDAPVSYFKMRLTGGKHGILVTVGNMCRRSRKAAVEIDGHNNAASDTHSTIKAPCAEPKKKTKKKR